MSRFSNALVYGILVTLVANGLGADPIPSAFAGAMAGITIAWYYYRKGNETAMERRMRLEYEYLRDPNAEEER